MQNWGVIAAAFGYIGLLFVVASYGDRLSQSQRARAGILIYPLSLAIYCTSWTFFGSIGLATRTNIEFLAIYVGPVLMIAFCTPLLRRVIHLAKTHNITSVADFVGARYGKSQAVAATAALIAIMGSVPYIALQLKAVASSLETILGDDQTIDIAISHIPVVGDIALVVTVAMALFAVLFGTRQTDATEHQHGLMLAVATESIVKLVVFIAAGAFVTFWMFSPADLFVRALKTPEAARAINHAPSIGNFLTMTLLSFFAIMLLPRQFHVSVVENTRDAEVSRARWLFPLYLVAINLFVIPIALAGLITFPFGAIDSDMYILALPIAEGSSVMSVLVFVGGLSAATAMVIVECIALAIMVSNDIVLPLALRRSPNWRSGDQNFASFLLNTRRVTIFAIMLMAYFYYRALGNTQLAAIGLLSFAAIAQLAPAFFGGLMWRRATARGAMGGMVVGFRRMGLHIVHSKPLRPRPREHAMAAAWPVRIRGLAPSGAAGVGPAAVDPRRALEPVAELPDIHSAVADAPTVVDRTRAGRSVCARHTCADDAEFPPLAHNGHRERHPGNRGPISRSRARTA